VLAKKKKGSDKQKQGAAKTERSGEAQTLKMKDPVRPKRQNANRVQLLEHDTDRD
jgi:hypothetical protein